MPGAGNLENVKIDIVDQSHLYQDPDDSEQSQVEVPKVKGPVDEFFVKPYIDKIVENDETSTFRMKKENTKNLLKTVNRKLYKEGVIEAIKSDYQSTKKSVQETLVTSKDPDLWLPGMPWVKPKPFEVQQREKIVQMSEAVPDAN